MRLMRLDVLTIGDCEEVRLWRNSDLSGLRTPRMLMKEDQEEFYYRLQAHCYPDRRYWAIREKRKDDATASGFYGEYWQLVGMGGLTDISLENRNAEISLIIDPELRGKGYGEEAVRLILEQAFNYMNLHSVYGEVYYCNVLGCKFWNKIIEEYKADWTELPLRKYWEGEYWMSRYFCITEGMYGKVH